MRILIHSRSFYPAMGGLEEVGAMLAAGLAKRGVEVVVATDVAGPPDAGGGYAIVRHAGTAALVRMARGMDVVHANGFSLVTAAIAIAARRPSVVTHHGYQAACLNGLGWHNGCRCDYRLSTCARLSVRAAGVRRTTRSLMWHAASRFAIRSAARHVAVSPFVAATLNLPRCEVIGNAVDRSMFTAAHGAPSNAPLLFAGRFVAEKGIDVLLAAAALLRDRGEEVSIDLAGTGPLEQHVRAEVVRLGLERVRLLGPLDRTRLAAAIRESRAVVVPSLNDEPFGMVAAEAVACGRPVIVTNRGALPDVAGHNGIVVPAGHAGELADAMARIRVAPPAVNDSADRFDTGRMIDAYLRVYSQLMQNPR